MKNHLQVLENIHRQFRTLAYSVDSWYSNIQMKTAISDLIARFFNLCKVEGLGVYDIHSGVESCKVTVRDEMKALNVVNDANKINFIAKLLQKQRNDLLMRYEELDDKPILNAEALQNLQINLDRLEEIRTEQGSLDLEQSNLMYRIKDLLMEDLAIMLGLRTILETLSPDSTRIFLDNVTIISNRLERKIKALADTGSPYTLISREAAEALDLQSLPNDALTTSQAIQGIGEKTQHIKGRTVDIVFANGRAVTITVYIFPRLRNVFGVDLLVGMDTLNAVSKSVHNQNIIDYNHPAKVIAAINESLFQPVEYDLYNTKTNPLSIGVSKEKLKAAKELEDLVRIKRTEASGDFTDEQYKYPHDPEPKRQDIRDKLPINYLEGLLEETQDLSDESDDTIGISKDILDEIVQKAENDPEFEDVRGKPMGISPSSEKFSEPYPKAFLSRTLDLSFPALAIDKDTNQIFWNGSPLTAEQVPYVIGQITALFQFGGALISKPLNQTGFFGISTPFTLVICYLPDRTDAAIVEAHNKAVDIIDRLSSDYYIEAVASGVFTCVHPPVTVKRLAVTRFGNLEDNESLFEMFKEGFKRLKEEFNDDMLPSFPSVEIQTFTLNFGNNNTPETNIVPDNHPQSVIDEFMAVWEKYNRPQYSHWAIGGEGESGKGGTYNRDEKFRFAYDFTKYVLNHNLFYYYRILRDELSESSAPETDLRDMYIQQYIEINDVTPINLIRSQFNMDPSSDFIHTKFRNYLRSHFNEVYKTIIDIGEIKAKIHYILSKANQVLTMYEILEELRVLNQEAGFFCGYSRWKIDAAMSIMVLFEEIIQIPNTSDFDYDFTKIDKSIEQDIEQDIDKKTMYRIAGMDILEFIKVFHVDEGQGKSFGCIKPIVTEQEDIPHKHHYVQEFEDLLINFIQQFNSLSDRDETSGQTHTSIAATASTFDSPIGIKLTEREVNTLRDESKLIFPIIKKEFQSQKIRKLIDLKSPALMFDKISKRVFWNSMRLTSENDIQVVIGQLTALFEYGAGSLYGTETDDFILVIYSNQPVTDVDLSFAVQINDSEMRQHLENRPFKRSSLTKITINFHRYWHSELDESEPTQSSDILGELYKQLKYQKFSNAFYVGYWMTRRLLAANYFKKAEREPEYHLDSVPRTKERILHTLADYGGRISLQKLKKKHSSLDELKIIKHLIKKGELQLFQGYDEKYIELPATDFLGFLERYIGQSFDNFVIGAVKNIYNDTKIESLKEYLVIGAISDYSPPELNFYEPKGKLAILRNARFLKFIKKLYHDFSDAHLRALSNLTLPVFIMSKTKELRYWNGLRLSSDYIAKNIAIMQGHFKALNTYGDGSFFSFKGKEFEGFAFAPDEISCVSIIKYAVSQAGLEDNNDGYMEISCVNRTKYIYRTLTDDQKYFHRKAHLNACLTLYENLCSSINQKEGDS